MERIAFTFLLKARKEWLSEQVMKLPASQVRFVSQEGDHVLSFPTASYLLELQ